MGELQQVGQLPPLVRHNTASPSRSGHPPAINDPEELKRLLWFVAKEAVFYGGMLLMVSAVAKYLDPQRKEKEAGKKATARLMSRLRRTGRAIEPLTDYEMQIVQDIVDPSELNVNFDKIGGLEERKQELQNIIVRPLTDPEMFRRADGSPSPLLAQPRGILLLGPPGTGKTMLAKAIAAESGAAFMNLRMSTIFNKYFGESNKLVSAVFSLASKLSPTIIFIDEIDSFMRNRSSRDEVHISTMRSEFMTLWDGMLTRDTEAVIVLGATNRPNDIDPAIQRRMPRIFEIGLPGESQRLHILQVLLQGEAVEHVDLYRIAARTSGYSGSDLKEVCRVAMVEPIHEYIAQTSAFEAAESAAAAAAAAAATAPAAVMNGTNGHSAAAAAAAAAAMNGNFNGPATGAHCNGHVRCNGAAAAAAARAETVNGNGAAEEDDVEATTMNGSGSDDEGSVLVDEYPSAEAAAGPIAAQASVDSFEALVPPQRQQRQQRQQRPPDRPRRVCDADFDKALAKVKPTGAAAKEYAQRQGQEGNFSSNGSDSLSFAEWMANPVSRGVLTLLAMQLAAQVSRSGGRNGGMA